MGPSRDRSYRGQRVEARCTAGLEGREVRLRGSHVVLKGEVALWGDAMTPVWFAPSQLDDCIS